MEQIYTQPIGASKRIGRKIRAKRIYDFKKEFYKEMEAGFRKVMAKFDECNID